MPRSLAERIVVEPSRRAHHAASALPDRPVPGDVAFKKKNEISISQEVFHN